MEAADPSRSTRCHRILAIDPGQRRVGVAISDPEGRLALPLLTLARRSDRQLVAELVALARREGVTELVVGEPLRLDGTAGDAARRARDLAGKLERASGLPCTLVNEALTSHAATERLRAAGIDPRRHRERIDQVAAQILLEEVLSRRQGTRP